MNIFNMAKDLKGMEKMMKPALEKFMNESGFCLLYTSDAADE